MPPLDERIASHRQIVSPHRAIQARSQHLMGASSNCRWRSGRRIAVPTILFIYGWRLFFYSNEGTEPIHVHAEKADMECKFWLLTDEVEIQEAFSFNLTPPAKKEIKKIIYQHFDLIIESWNNYFTKK